MSKFSTFLVTFIIIAAFAVGLYLFQNGSGGNLQGQLNRDNLSNSNTETPSDATDTTSSTTETPVDTTNGGTVTIPANLSLSAQVETPTLPNGDLKVSVAITNDGPGHLSSGNVVRYTIFVNDQEVFSKNNTTVSLAPGEFFDFVYPVARSIYQYPESGVVRVELNGTESIELPYSF